MCQLSFLFSIYRTTVRFYSVFNYSSASALKILMHFHVVSILSFFSFFLGGGGGSWGLMGVFFLFVFLKCVSQTLKFLQKQLTCHNMNINSYHNRYLFKKSDPVFKPEVSSESEGL